MLKIVKHPNRGQALTEYLVVAAFLVIGSMFWLRPYRGQPWFQNMVNQRTRQIFDQFTQPIP